MLEPRQSQVKDVASAVPPPPAPSEAGGAPETGTGRTSSSHHPDPRSK